MDLNNNRFNFRSSQESLFGCSSQESSSFNGSPIQDTNYSSPGFSGYDDVFDVSMLKSSSQPLSDISIDDHYQQRDDRSQTRRLKNRESAARSRQKIKSLLQNLEIHQKKLLNRKHAIENERSVAIKEVDRLESSMLNMKINQISGVMLKEEIKDDDHSHSQHQQQQQQQHQLQLATFIPFTNLEKAIIKKEESLSSMLQQ